MIGIYVRVSTVMQNEASQIREIERWLAGNGSDPAQVRWFIDKETGDTLERPEFENLQRAIFLGEVKTVVCWKLDRLSRSLQDGINLLCDWCKQGIRVVSVTQQLDFSGKVGKLIASVLFAVAEMEQEVRRERQAAGIAAAKERGVYRGRKPGTTKTSRERVLELRQTGLSVGEVAAACGISRRSVLRYSAGA